MANRRSAAPIIAAVLLLLAIYVGCYFALVNPADIQAVHERTRKSVGPIGAPSNYRTGGEWEPRVFWPLEQIHRKLRPEPWEPGDQLRSKIVRWQRQNPTP